MIQNVCGILAIAIGVSVGATACRAAADQAGPVRPAAKAGQFYPGDPAVLNTAVSLMLQEATPPTIDGRAVAFMVPHAGYIYSARTAAHVYKLLLGRKVTTAVLLGNSHNFPLARGAVYARGAFATPLGQVAVNEALALKILALTPLLAADPAPHIPEHSLEVQIPFLQKVAPGCRIVPILVGNQDMAQCRAIGEAIADAITALKIENETVIIDSTDATHYPAYDDAVKVENAAIQSLERLDPPGLAKTIGSLMADNVPNLACVFCGEESLYAAMFAARRLGATSAKILAHTNSGDVKAGDKARVVGYVAAAFVRPPDGHEGKEAMMKETTVDDKGFSVSAANQQVLLTTARQAIEHYLAGGKRKVFSASDPVLNKPAAVFVTLTSRGQLRGCIGTTEPRMPLIEAVGYFAVAAAVEDGRFPPVTTAELGSIHIEISVLSPMTKIESAEAITPKIHGVVVRKGMHSGLFLPQVWEHFEKKDDFLNELCWQKAHLDPAAWKDPATDLYVFTVFAFEEPLAK